jgi:hypothetical protein
MVALFTKRNGTRPAPWDHTVLTPQTDPSRDPVIEREGQLLRRVALSQYIALGAILVSLGGLVHSWHLGTKIKETIRPYVIEVNRKDAPEGEVRAVQLPQAPYAKPDIGNQLHVVAFWIWHWRSVGDSKVLQGQAWQHLLAFTDESLHPWLQTQIAERRKVFQHKETVQIRNLEILPVDLEARQFRVSWLEERISLSGEVGKPQHHVLTLTLVVKPPETLQKAKDYKNTLGILVKRVNWFAVNQKGAQS